MNSFMLEMLRQLSISLGSPVILAQEHWVCYSNGTDNHVMFVPSSWDDEALKTRLYLEPLELIVTCEDGRPQVKTRMESSYFQKMTPPPKAVVTFCFRNGIAHPVPESAVVTYCETLEESYGRIVYDSYGRAFHNGCLLPFSMEPVPTSAGPIPLWGQAGKFESKSYMLIKGSDDEHYARIGRAVVHYRYPARWYDIYYPAEQILQLFS